MLKFLYKDYLTTLLTSLLTTGITFILFKLAGHFYGQEGFSVFTISKRTMAFAVTVLDIGMCLALCRETARVYNTQNSLEQYIFLRYAIFSQVVILFVVGLFIYIFLDYFSIFLFSSKKYAPTLFFLYLNICSILFSEIAYSYYRGVRKQQIANLIYALNLGIIPLITFLFSSSIANYFAINSIFVIFSTILFLGSVFFKGTKQKFAFIHFKLFIMYGVGRLSGNILYQLLFLLVPIISLHYSNLINAGQLSFSLGLLNFVSIPMYPLATILLPKAVSIFATGDQAESKRFLNRITLIAFITGSIAGTFLILASPLIADFFLEGTQSSLFYISISGITAIPFAVFMALRNLVDARSRTPYNSFNLLFIFILLIFSFFIVYLTQPLNVTKVLAVLFSIAFWLLAILTYICLVFLLRKKEYVI